MSANARRKFIARCKKDPEFLARCLFETMKLASTHDPDLEMRISVLERQMERMGAPSYRVIKRGRR